MLGYQTLNRLSSPGTRPDIAKGGVEATSSRQVNDKNRHGRRKGVSTIDTSPGTPFNLLSYRN
jgi:hypothetical protein